MRARAMCPRGVRCQFLASRICCTYIRHEPDTLISYAVLVPTYQLRACESHAAHALIRWLQFDESWLVAIPGRRTTTASP